MAVNLTLEQVKGLLKKANQVIVDEKRSGNNLGTVLKLANGCIINCWDKGTVNCQGKNAEQIVAILSEAPTSPIQNRKVFVVYGHDNNARTQLEAMLRRWDLEPMILDQLISSGQTIIVLSVLIKDSFTDQFDDAKLTLKFGQVRRKISLSEFSGLIAEYDITSDLEYAVDGSVKKESLYALADRYALTFLEDKE